MHFRITLVMLALTGCTAAPVLLNAHQSCDVAPSVWKQVDAPPNREALLGLPEQTRKKPVLESFAATSTQREVWFEDSDHNLQACIYNPQHACYTAELYKVVFKKVEASWEAGAIVQIQCWDD